MQNRPLAVLISYVLSVAIPLGLGLYARLKNRGGVSRSFFAFLFLHATWSLVALFELVSVSHAAKLFWDDMQFLIGGLVGVAILSFSYRYDGTWFKRGWSTLWLLASAPAATFAFLLSDPLHHLAMVPRKVAENAEWGGYAYRYTTPTFVLAGLLMAIALAGIGRIGLSAVRELSRRNLGGLVIFVGLLLALFGSILAIYGPNLLGHGPWLSSTLNAAPIWLGGGDLIIAVGVLRFRLFGFLPVARKVLFEGLGSPVFVVDDTGLLVDFNRAFAELTGLRRRDAAGRPVMDALASWPEDARKAFASAEDTPLTRIPVRCGGRVFEVEVRPILEARGRESRGRIAVMSDVTSLKETEKEILAVNQRLERRVVDRTTELEREVARRSAAETLLRALNAEILSTQREIMVTLSGVVETRSRETARHVLRVGEYTRILARAKGLAPENVALMADASPLHDIGKIGVPEAILNKASALSDEERALMQNHTTIGYDILYKSERSLIRAAAVIALDHHENWDGTGYPSGKAGAAISLSGRIVRVCDVFDALLSERAYKPAWGRELTLEYFRSERGRLFDPDLIDIFFLNLDPLLEVAESYPDEASPTEAMLI